MKTGVKVLDAMTKNPVVVSPEMSLISCAKTMLNHKVGSVLVKDNGNLLGIVTEKDLVRKVVAKNLDTKNTPIKKIMTKRVLTISPNEEI